MVIRRKINTLPLFTFVLSLFLLRPMVLGYVYTTIGLTIVVITTIVMYINNDFQLKLLQIKNKYILKYIFITYAPVFLFNVFNNGMDEIKDVAIVAIASCCLCQIFSYDKSMKHFIDLISLIFSLIIISSIITFILGFNKDFSSLEVFKFSIRNREDLLDGIRVYFPFSPLYSFFTTEKFALPRFSFFFVEAGIAPGFFTPLFFFHLKFTKGYRKYFYMLIFFAGCLLSFSTSFFILFMSGIIVNYISSVRIKLSSIIILIVFATLGYIIFTKVPYIGFNDKSQTHGTSFDDRVTALEFSIDNLGRWIKIICTTILFFLILKRKSNKLIFLVIFIPIYLSGLINVVFFSPLFLAFCFFDSLYIDKTFYDNKLINRKEELVVS